MKNILLLIALVFTTMTLSAQETVQKDLKSKRVNIKVSPTMPFLESFGGGVEIFIVDNVSVELEGKVSNLIAASTDFIYGNTTYDDTKYKQFSSRLKLHKRKSTYSISERGFYNSLYIAPGLNVGNERYKFYKETVSNYGSATFDLGLIFTRFNNVTFESFIGCGLKVQFTPDDGTQLAPLGRMGFRVGVIF